MIEGMETAIVARLDGAIEGARCRGFPERPRGYRHSGREAELFVAYRGSRPKRIGTVDLLGQTRIQTWDVHLITRDLRTHQGAYVYLDAIRRRLHGWLCPNAADVMVPAREEFVGEDDGVWTYVSSFEQDVVVVADPDTEDLPLLTRVTTVDDDGETTTTESEAP